MPCNSIITQSVDLAKLTDQSLLESALREVGRVYVVGQGMYQLQWNASLYYVRDGQITGRADDIGIVADQIKRAYSKQAIYASAKKQGWAVKQTAENKFQIIRRF